MPNATTVQPILKTAPHTGNRPKRNKHEHTPTSETIPGFFAKGINFYKIFWVFFLASFIGCIVEILFCYATSGVLMNRSGVLYGPFSLVWGGGAVIFTLCFQKLLFLRDLWIFLGGTVIGGVYEYLCSWLQEVAFGTSFWDYSAMPFNINGRVNLLYCMFWGLAALVWVKDIYPRMCRWIGKIPNIIGKPLTWVLCILMLANCLVSGAALWRMDNRQQHIPAKDPFTIFLDEHYPDERLFSYYPNMRYKDAKQ
ncbi:MAG: putative ABC transporter permease [Oscillospiraceae bacterium]